MSKSKQIQSLTGSDEGGVQGFYPIGGHDDFDVSPRVEAVQLIEQLQHGPLDLPLSTRVRVVPAQQTGSTHFYSDPTRLISAKSAKVLPNNESLHLAAGEKQIEGCILDILWHLVLKLSSLFQVYIMPTWITLLQSTY